MTRIQSGTLVSAVGRTRLKTCRHYKDVKLALPQKLQAYWKVTLFDVFVFFDVISGLFFNFFPFMLGKAPIRSRVFGDSKRVFGKTARKLLILGYFGSVLPHFLDELWTLFFKTAYQTELYQISWNKFNNVYISFWFHSFWPAKSKSIKLLVNPGEIQKEFRIL